ncbi:MAG: FAD-dependent monooxygenase [Bacteroidota bacterium]
MDQVEVLLIGGGLAGLIAALELRQHGREVCLVERKSYPFHKVCGEYISKETLPLLDRLGLDPFALGAQDIRRLCLSSPRGTLAHSALPLGAYSISRYSLDFALAQLCVRRGVKLQTGIRVESVQPNEAQQLVHLSDGREIRAKTVIAAYGKRSHLDRQFKRPFFQQRSPFLGVKYHARMDFPADLVRLHNFQAGYCGISRVEGEDTVNICFLTSRNHLRAHKSIPRLIEAVLHRNPALKADLEQATSLFEQALAINEISFASKDLIINDIPTVGDAAGMIMPLVGNGMAMAMQGAWLLSGWVEGYLAGRYDWNQFQQGYTRDWQMRFRLRLWAGRQLQSLFARNFWSEMAVRGLAGFPRIGQRIISQTHGKAFGHQAYVAKP